MWFNEFRIAEQHLFNFFFLKLRLDLSQKCIFPIFQNLIGSKCLFRIGYDEKKEEYED